jgi:hypothetical protein
MKRHQIYLSRRNLLTLLSKLDRLENGDATACAIIKSANPADPYCNTIDQVVVTAVADEEFYANRQPGVMHPLDEANL